MTGNEIRCLLTVLAVCTEDRAPWRRRNENSPTRADKVIEVEAGHHPFLSQPQTIADIIASL